MKLKHIYPTLLLVLPLMVWAKPILITEANGTFAGLGHARTHDFPVEARIFTVKVSDADTSGTRSVSVEVSVNDLHTGNAIRDSHMRMSVLDRKKHPLITFVSDLDMADLRVGDVMLVGTLQINGVSKPHTLNLNLQKYPDQWQATGSMLIKPTDFGLPLVGLGPMKVLDAVDLDLSVRFQD